MSSSFGRRATRTATALVVVATGLASLAACAGPKELEPLSGPAPRPSTGDTVTEPAAEFDRPPIDIPLIMGEPHPVTLVEAGAEPRQTIRVQPALGTVQRVTVRQSHSTVSTFQAPGGPLQSESLTIGPYEHVADSVVVDSSGDRYTYDRWLSTYDISQTGRGYENLDLREDFSATELSDGVRLIVSDRNDVLGFTVLNPVVPEHREAVQRTLAGEHFLLAALPSEPIGVGAVWTINGIGPISGYLFDHVATLTLTEVHDDRVVVTFQQTAHPRPEAEQSTIIGGLQEYSGSSEGTITYRFDLPIPLLDVKLTSGRVAESQFGRGTLHTSDHLVVELRS